MKKLIELLSQTTDFLTINVHNFFNYQKKGEDGFSDFAMLKTE